MLSAKIQCETSKASDLQTVWGVVAIPGDYGNLPTVNKFKVESIKTSLFHGPIENRSAATTENEGIRYLLETMNTHFSQQHS